MLPENLEIRHVTQNEFEIAAGWAASEGWNPGLEDLPAFYAADPKGFFMGFINDIPISSITAIRYGDDFGFIGFYIVHPEYRGQGIGLATWNMGMAYLKGRNIGLDGVIDQQENYKKSGFSFAGRNIRHTGIPKSVITIKNNIEIQDINQTDLAHLQIYDEIHFPAPRPQFINCWIMNKSSRGRCSKIAITNDKISGYGAIRPCRAGYKIGPLFADNDEIALNLLSSLFETIETDAEISLDTPEGNIAALKLAKKFGLTPVFETARMYTGVAAKIPLKQIYGITSFELG